MQQILISKVVARPLEPNFFFMQLHISVSLLTVKQLIMHTAAFFLTAPQVSEIQPMMFYTLPTPMSFSLSCNSAFSTFIKDIAKQEFCTSNPANLLTISLTLPDQFPLLFAAGEGNHLQFCVRALVIVRTTSIITRKG